MKKFFALPIFAVAAAGLLASNLASANMPESWIHGEPKSWLGDKMDSLTATEGSIAKKTQEEAEEAGLGEDYDRAFTLSDKIANDSVIAQEQKLSRKTRRPWYLQ